MNVGVPAPFSFLFFFLACGKAKRVNRQKMRARAPRERERRGGSYRNVLRTLIRDSTEVATKEKSQNSRMKKKIAAMQPPQLHTSAKLLSKLEKKKKRRVTETRMYIQSCMEKKIFCTDLEEERGRRKVKGSIGQMFHGSEALRRCNASATEISTIERAAATAAVERGETLRSYISRLQREFHDNPSLSPLIFNNTRYFFFFFEGESCRCSML